MNLPQSQAMRDYVDLVASGAPLPDSVLHDRMHLLRDDKGFSALDLAVYSGNVLTLDRLCALGADPFMLDDQQVTLLALASSFGRPDMLRRILDLGIPVNAVDRDGWSPLMYAARAGDHACLLMLLHAGADPALTDQNGDTARSCTEDPTVIQILDRALSQQEACDLDAHLPPPRLSTRPFTL